MNRSSWRIVSTLKPKATLWGRSTVVIILPFGGRSDAFIINSLPLFEKVRYIYLAAGFCRFSNIRIQRSASKLRSDRDRNMRLLFQGAMSDRTIRSFPAGLQELSDLHF
jgi:hypothetical protein